jgi:hypothetical protein
MEIIKRAIFILVVCLDETCSWVIFLRMIFEMARVYTKKFTLLKTSPIITNGNMFVAVNSLISIHLIRKPAMGGSPAKFAITKSRIHFSFLEFGDALIFFCFEFFKNMITSRTELQ